MLREKDDLKVEDMKRIHYDLYALQARAFMAIIRPLLPESENGKLLRGVDLCYDADSLGATLLERCIANSFCSFLGITVWGARW